MSETHQRLKIFAKSKFGSITKLELELNKSSGYFNSYFRKGSMFGGDLLEILLTKYNLNINWLLAGIGEMYIKLPNTENVEVLESKSSKVPIMTNENMSEILERLSNIEKKLEEV